MGNFIIRKKGSTLRPSALFNAALEALDNAIEKEKKKKKILQIDNVLNGYRKYAIICKEPMIMYFEK